MIQKAEHGPAWWKVASSLHIWKTRNSRKRVQNWLQDGDRVVFFTEKCLPYTVVPTAESCFQYMAQLPENSPAEQDACDIPRLSCFANKVLANPFAQLHVLKHEHWFGFRSQVAHGKTLQMHNKRPEIQFANYDFDTWEQWTLSCCGGEVEVQLHGGLCEGRRLTLRSRRHPAFALNLFAVRLPRPGALAVLWARLVLDQAHLTFTFQASLHYTLTQMTLYKTQAADHLEAACLEVVGRSRQSRLKSSVFRGWRMRTEQLATKRLSMLAAQAHWREAWMRSVLIAWFQEVQYLKQERKHPEEAEPKGSMDLDPELVARLAERRAREEAEERENMEARERAREQEMARRKAEAEQALAQRQAEEAERRRRSAEERERKRKEAEERERLEQEERRRVREVEEERLRRIKEVEEERLRRIKEERYRTTHTSSSTLTREVHHTYEDVIEEHSEKHTFTDGLAGLSGILDALRDEVKGRSKMETQVSLDDSHARTAIIASLWNYTVRDFIQEMNAVGITDRSLLLSLRDALSKSSTVVNFEVVTMGSFRHRLEQQGLRTEALSELVSSVAKIKLEVDATEGEETAVEYDETTVVADDHVNIFQEVVLRSGVEVSASKFSEDHVYSFKVKKFVEQLGVHDLDSSSVLEFVLAAQNLQEDGDTRNFRGLTVRDFKSLLEGYGLNGSAAELHLVVVALSLKLSAQPLPDHLSSMSKSPAGTPRATPRTSFTESMRSMGSRTSHTESMSQFDGEDDARSRLMHRDRRMRRIRHRRMASDNR